MGFGGSQDSFIANAASRREKINSARRTLNLGERGVNPVQQPVPPAVPAQRVPPTADQNQEEESPELASSDNGDMLSRVTRFVNEQQADRAQKMVTQDQATPGLDTKDGRVLEVKRFQKLFTPWRFR